jgi:hypothetical protein
MPTKKNKVKVSELKGLKLYNFLVKQLGESNKSLPNSQRIGINLCRVINENIQQYGKLENAEFTPAIVVLGDGFNLPTENYLEGDIYISKYF